MNDYRRVNSPAMLWLIHFSFVMTVPVYAVVTRFVLVPQQGGRGGAPLPPALLFAILGAVALTSLMAALALGMKLRPQPGPVGDSPMSAQEYLAKTTTFMVVTDALYESIAIYGLVGVVLGLPPWQGYLFMGLSLVILLGRVAQLRAWTDEYQRLKSGEAGQGKKAGE